MTVSLEYKTYDRAWAENLFRRGKLPKAVYFWGHRNHNKNEVTKACLSQWWPCEFKVDGETYVSAEHWMMAEKARLFNAPEILQKILSTRKPGAAKAFGRQIIGFDQKIWDERKYDIVVQGNRHKFSQNKNLEAFLLGTKKRLLVEASPVDRVWGIGLAVDNEHCANPLKWKGQNHLGFALMSVRDILSVAKQ